jgi:hypothetical protein
MIPDETFFDYDMLHERRKGRLRRLLMLVTVMMCGAMGAGLAMQNAKPYLTEIATGPIASDSVNAGFISGSTQTQIQAHN